MTANRRLVVDTARLTGRVIRELETDPTGRPLPSPPPEDYGPPISVYEDGADWADESLGEGLGPGTVAERGPAATGPPRVSDRRPSEVLKEVFGYDSFRPLQAEIINSILELRDTLAIMPTGGGKSLCYQLPALLFDGLTVVVSPLISLMQDQARQLDAAGIGVAVLNSSLDRRTYARHRRMVLDGRAKLLYLAPETLMLERTLGLLRGVRVSCLTIDEAHCISEWGHDFRPEYRRLTEIRAQFPEAVCIGLTATATPRVRDDIATSLGFSQDARFVASFDRPNLVLRVEEKDRPLQQLLGFIERVGGGSGIVYCTTRNGVDTLAERLSARGHSVRPYHAGLGEEVRRENQERFIRDDVDIVCATVAFGMGINKPDVRYVVHYNVPKSIEGYYQEIGRAGRDGTEAQCLLLYSTADLGKMEFFISQKSDSEQRVARLQLSRMQAYSETTLCRRRPLLDYFGERYAGGESATCGACDNCLEPKRDLVDLTVSAQKYLSCVYRTGQRYGSGLIVEVLRGSRSKKVLEPGHDRLSTYGIGKDMDVTQWRHIGRQLIQHGLLEQDSTYGSLRLTAKAGEILRGRGQFEGRLPSPAKSRSRSGSRRTRGTAESGPTDYDRDLFQRLRQERKVLADAQNVPPYVVFSDRTLRELAAAQPRSVAALSDIHGVGAVKLARYGQVFLDEIAAWCEDQGLPALPRVEVPPLELEPRDTTLSDSRRARLAALVNGGEPLDAAAEREGIRVETAVAHLERHVASGGPLDPKPIRSAVPVLDRPLAAIMAAFDVHGSDRLRPVFDALGGDVDYPTLRLARLLRDARRS